jgi:hypothetical protein
VAARGPSRAAIHHRAVTVPGDVAAVWLSPLCRLSAAAGFWFTRVRRRNLIFVGLPFVVAALHRQKRSHLRGIQVLESISLKFTELAEPLRVPAQGVTIFVGPNNSGKSLVLREIEQDISTHSSIASKILSDFEIAWINEEQLNDDIAKLTKKAPAGTSPDISAPEEGSLEQLCENGRVNDLSLGLAVRVFQSHDANVRRSLQAAHKEIGAVRIPAAAIVDVDILKDGGGNWIPWLEAAHVPPASHVGLGHQRATLHKLFIDQNLDMENGGIKQLGKEDQAAANDLFDQLRQYGIFALRNGEVESWLPALGIRSKKAAWAVEMLERLGSDPSDAEYVKPAAGDVWDFMRDVVKWVKEPGRKGTD